MIRFMITDMGGAEINTPQLLMNERIDYIKNFMHYTTLIKLYIYAYNFQ